MVVTEIRGKEFPLCLTVEALDQINKECGGMGKIGSYLDGEGAADPVSQAVINTVWMLGVLLQAGEENRLMLARLDGEAAERRAIPGVSDLRALLTVASARHYRIAVVDAVNESMTQTIEAMYPKNADHAGQE